jgi:hypothetical protein
MGSLAREAKMPEMPLLNRSLFAETGSTGPMPPGTGRVQQLVEWIGIALFAALVIGTAVILMRNR